jgi:hypothetical protein
MRTINPVKAGLAFGVVLGLFHLCWAALVAFGVAQAVIDFILGLHFIAPFMTVQPFALPTAAMLVAITALIGFAIGVVFAISWNALHPAER